MRGLIFTALYYLISAVFVILALFAMILPFRRPVRFLIKQYARTMRGLMHWVAGISTEIRGKDNLPDGPFILAAKHQSWGDGFQAYSTVSNLSFVTGDHLEKFPFVGRILNRIGAIVIDTCGGGERKAASLIEGMQKAKSDGRRVLIYPEGALCPVDHHFRYKPGIWHMQKAMDVPVIPVATNLGVFWKQAEMAKTPGKSVLEFLPPIPPGMDKGEFMLTLQTQIETQTAKLVAEGRGGAEMVISTQLPDPKPLKANEELAST